MVEAPAARREAVAATDIRKRLTETGTYRGAGTITAPDFRIALTETDQPSDVVAVAVPVTV